MSGLSLPELAGLLGTPTGELRANAERLREAAHALDAAADRLEAGAANGRTVLKGREIIDCLCELIESGKEFHYSTAFDALVAAGYVPRGKDPRNTLLSALSRSPYFSSVGSRTGRFRRNAPEDEAR